MMISAKATRRTTLNGKTYEKGEKVSMPAQQFGDLLPTKRFERAAAEKKVSSPKPGLKSDTAPD